MFFIMENSEKTTLDFLLNAASIIQNGDSENYKSVK